MFDGVVEEVIVEPFQDHVIELEQKKFRELEGRGKLSGELPHTVQKEKKHWCLGGKDSGGYRGGILVCCFTLKSRCN